MRVEPKFELIEIFSLHRKSCAFWIWAKFQPNIAISRHFCAEIYCILISELPCAVTVSPLVGATDCSRNGVKRVQRLCWEMIRGRLCALFFFFCLVARQPMAIFAHSRNTEKRLLLVVTKILSRLQWM